MRASVAVGLLVEEHRSEVVASWKASVERELGGEPAIGFAVGPLLREMALALRAEGAPAPGRAEDGQQRCAVLIRSGAQPGRTAREFKLLHRAVWDTLRAAGRIVGAEERRAVDEWLDDALAASLDRMDRMRARTELLDRPAPAVTRAKPEAAAPQRPPPLPRARPAATPPPLPALSDAHSGHH